MPIGKLLQALHHHTIHITHTKNPCIYLKGFHLLQRKFRAYFRFRAALFFIFFCVVLAAASLSVLLSFALHRTCRKSILYLLFYELQFLRFSLLLRDFIFILPHLSTHRLHVRLLPDLIYCVACAPKGAVLRLPLHPHLPDSDLPRSVALALRSVSLPVARCTLLAYRLIGIVCAAMKRRGT